MGGDTPKGGMSVLGQSPLGIGSSRNGVTPNGLTPTGGGGGLPTPSMLLNVDTNGFISTPATTPNTDAAAVATVFTVAQA